MVQAAGMTAPSSASPDAVLLVGHGTKSTCGIGCRGAGIAADGSAPATVATRRDVAEQGRPAAASERWVRALDRVPDLDNQIAALHRAARFPAGRNALGIQTHDAAVASERPGLCIDQAGRLCFAKGKYKCN